MNDKRKFFRDKKYSIQNNGSDTQEKNGAEKKESVVQEKQNETMTESDKIKLLQNHYLQLK